MVIGVRPWTVADIPQIAAIMAAHTLWQQYGVTHAQAALRLTSLFSEGESGLVAQIVGATTIAGFVVYNRKTLGDAGYIRLLGVAPGFTSRGLGAQLLEQVEERLVKENTYRLLLLCTEWNRRAQHFYQRQGFILVGRLADWIQVGTTELLFAKYLEPGGR
ncbi:MAG: hypothetical protein C7B45_06385 [Sulfobacillus acidophilus]|uniref:N-acetyltransferase domain-containing protein n=1 Tax=Sulfobacillus acidophilus TaxID=53633 RepID=A0A2T2WJZ4_9FIRM|nr:MAG: hypothetical protein C7B45_06385 [Sulfobacillus acidophilus]